MHTSPTAFNTAVLSETRILLRLLHITAACCLLAMLLTMPAWASAKPASELVFGVYPYLSPSKTVEQFSPLTDYLSKTLGRPVTLRSAPNFASFIERTRAGEYDFIFTAPHMGRLAQVRDGYLPLAQTGNPFIMVIVVKKDSPLRSVADLRDRAIAIGAKLSMTYQATNHTLSSAGLELGRNVKFVDTASFSNIVRAVMKGEADAGAGPISLLYTPEYTSEVEQLREIHRSDPIPSFFLLGHPRLGTAMHEKLRSALMMFHKSPTGQVYFGKTLQQDFRPLDTATLKRLDPYTKVFDAR